MPSGYAINASPGPANNMLYNNSMIFTIKKNAIERMILTRRVCVHISLLRVFSDPETGIHGVKL